MKILGLSLGYLATASLYIDNEIVACVSEERFSRLKNDEAYPVNAINSVLEIGGIKGSELDAVAIASKELNLATHLTRTYSSWTIEDYIKSMRELWYPKFYEGREVNYYDVFKDKIDLKQYPGNWDKLFDNVETYFSKVDSVTYCDHIHDIICKDLGISKDKIQHMDHHTCHASYAYWGSPLRGDDVLIMAADAYGDGYSNTLSMVDDEGSMKRVHSVPHNEFTLGRLYRYITLVLGMKPAEHEYKVMGLAPYAKAKYAEKAYQVFKKHMYVDGIDFKFHEKPIDNYFWFRERLEGIRFDDIAGGLQRYVEEIMLTYTQNALEHFKAKRLVYSGGISMNIKTNMVIKDIEGLEDMFVCGSGGDESLAIGACYAYAQQNGQRDMQGLENMYLGPELNQADVQSVIEEAKAKNYRVIETTADAVSDLLVEGKVIGRCCGRMEFGARSLGNRSIIADPRNRQIVDVINHKIKNRDFWMPFAPTVMEDYVDEYILNEKKMYSPFMTIGFESTEKGRSELDAATHPSDKTLRPQMLKKEANPGYYELLDAFRQKTGVAGVLNTSFNLHGKPIVNTPQEAYYVFEATDIDAVVFDTHTIIK